MTNPTGGRRLGLRAAAAAALFLLLTGSGSTGPDLAQQSGSVGESIVVPSPAADALPYDPHVPSTAPTAPTASTPPAQPLPPAMAASPPKAVNIAAIGADSPVIRLNLDSQGALEVPPGKPGSPAGWYVHSPTPGEPGPAVILGHVNAEGGGPGIFADLRNLQPGDEVSVAREDGTTAVFSVLRAEQYPKDAFPTEQVYGNTAGPELRLITCDGYDPKTGTFDDNYVVYARLKG